MAFIAGLLPLLSSMGIGGAALGTAATVVPSVLGALDIASGIVQKDPAKIASGAVSAAVPVLGSGSGLGAAADAAAPTASVSGNVVSGLELGDKVRQGLDAPMGVGKAMMIPEISTAGAQAFLPTGKSMSLAEKIGAGLEGGAAAASGVMSILNSLKNKEGSSGGHLGLGALDTSLSPFGGSQSSPLPSIPTIQVPGAGKVPQFELTGLPNNELVLQLLQAYKA